MHSSKARYRRKHRLKKRRSVNVFTWESSEGASAPQTRPWGRFGWPLPAFLATVLCLTGIIFFLYKYFYGSEARKIPLQTVEQEESLPPIEKAEVAVAAITVLTDFINARNHLDRCDYVVGGGKILNLLEKHYEIRGRQLPRRIINPVTSAVELNGRQIILISFTDESGKQIAAPFEWSGDKYLLHWEAMTGYGDIALPVFFAQQTPGLFSIRGTIFVPERQDSIQIDSSPGFTALLSHPDLSEPRIVFIPDGSSAHHHLEDFPRNVDIPAHISVTWRNSNDTGLPVIAEWHHKHWIAP